LKNFALLLLSGMLLAGIVITQSLGRYSDTFTPLLKLLSDRSGIWHNARVHFEKENAGITSWLLNDEVMISREWNGVVHIQAKNENDAYMAWGYALARDRMFQMQYLKTAAQGRLTTWYGTEAIYFDDYFLNLGLEEAARRQISRMSEEEYNLLKVFSNGVNLYLSELSEDEYPIEIRLQNIPVSYWSPMDCVRILKLWEYMNSYTLQDLEKQIIAKNIDSSKLYADLFKVSLDKVPEKDPSIDPVELLKQMQMQQAERDRWLFRPPPESRDYGLLIPPGKMQRNNAVFVGFTLGEFSFPGFFYEVQITTPKQNAYGFSFPGAPLMSGGFTPAIAWNFGRPETPAVKFLYQGNDSPPISVEERSSIWNMRYEGQSSHTELTTPFGPVFRSSSSEIFINWTAFKTDRIFLFFNDLLHATSVDTLQRRSKLPVLASTLNMGDAQGRSLDLNLFSMPDDKDGVVALAEKHLIETQPRPVNQNGLKSRNRIRHIVDEKSRHSIDDIMNYTRDVYLDDQPLRRLMLNTIKGFKEKEWLEIAYELQNWNMQANNDSKLMPLISSFVMLMRKYVWDEIYDVSSSTLPDDSIWVDLALNSPSHPIFDNRSTGRIETADEVVESALRDALNINIIENGPFNSWSWGEINKVKPKFSYEELIGKLYIVDYYSKNGFTNTVNPSFGKNPVYGYVNTFVVEFRPGGNVNAFVNTLGNNRSLSFDNENYLSIDLWSRTQYRPVRFASTGGSPEYFKLALKPYAL
jgi:acyl-homoserine lactone acylase PvdQ